MGNLNDSINRIKGMMKMIHESDFSVMDQLPNQNPDQNKWDMEAIIMYVMANFSEHPHFEDSDIDLSEGYFIIVDSESRYELTYNFDVEVTSRGSYDPGDRDTPPYYEGPEWEITNLKLTIMDIGDGEYKELYSGPDISNFEKQTFPPVKPGGRAYSGWDKIYDEFDEKISDMVNDYD